MPWRCWGGIFDWDNALQRLDELNALSEDPELWNDSDKAQKIMRERNRLDSQITKVREIEQSGQSPELGGVTTEITVMFMDVRGFTTLSETLSSQPQTLTRIINIILDAKIFMQLPNL